MRNGSRKRRSTRRMGCASAAWLIACVAVACGPSSTTVPADLAGTWRTARSGYDGRVMEFLDDAILFRASEEQFTVHPLQSIEARRQVEEERWRYDLVYLHLGERIEATLYLDDRGDLVFEHQRGVKWRRAPAE